MPFDHYIELVGLYGHMQRRWFLASPSLAVAFASKKELFMRDRAGRARRLELSSSAQNPTVP